MLCAGYCCITLKRGTQEAIHRLHEEALHFFERSSPSSKISCKVIILTERLDLDSDVGADSYRSTARTLAFSCVSHGAGGSGHPNWWQGIVRLQCTFSG